MANPVNISQERWNSETYLTIPKEKGCLCRPVIIDIRKTYFGIFPKERDSASRDVDLLKRTFKQLGFLEPHIISTLDPDSDKYDHPLYSVENLKRKLVSIGKISFSILNHCMLLFLSMGLIHAWMYRTQNGTCIAINNNYIYNISINELRYVGCHYDCAAQLYFSSYTF